MPPKHQANRDIIIRNTFWMSLETVTDIVAGFIASVLVARAMGPTRLGYYVLISWTSGVAGRIGVGGVAMAERKFMAEYLGRGDYGTARTVFLKALRAQLVLGVVLTSIGLVIAVALVESSYLFATILLVLSILPAMLVSVPSQAFTAAENSAANVPGAIVGNVLFVGGVLISLALGWGLAGIAGSFLLMRSGECVVRFRSCLRWLRPFTPSDVLPGVVTQMGLFALRGAMLTLLTTILLDRSELLFLRIMRNDVRELSYYSLACGISEKVTLFILVFGRATGTTLLAQFGRDERRLGAMLRASHRYLALLAFPMNVGLAVLSGPVIAVVYGSQYAPTGLVLAWVALFAIPKAFTEPHHRALEAAGHQSFVLWCTLVLALVNLGLDWLLIPRFGPLGAAIANGVAQLIGVLSLVRKSNRTFQVNDAPRYYVKLACCSGAMGIVVWMVTALLPASGALFFGVPCGIVVFTGGLKFAKLLEPEDHERLRAIRNKLPRSAGLCFDWILAVLIPEREGKHRH